MTDAEKWEKVIKGLERELAIPDFVGAASLLRDAIALMKAQEPRVMTLKEVEAMPYGHVLIETDKKDSLRWLDALLFSKNANYSFDFITLEGRARLLGTEYNREWRCWTSRPTDEQRGGDSVGMSTKITLPCKPCATVYTINEDCFACDGCAHEAHARYIPEINCRGCDTGLHCPLRIREHIVKGFEVSASPGGEWIVSKPGEWGYEGLEEFSGFDGNVYYSREDAERAIDELNVIDAEHERGRANNG